MSKNVVRSESETRRRDEPASDASLEQVRQALVGLKFGEVNVIVQDGLVIQIDRTEKKRLRRPVK